MTGGGDRRPAVMLVDKPPARTSFDVVREIRSGSGVKIGHAGTLDPFATGLLLVLAGQATRLSGLLMDLLKEYVVEAQFGAVSSTQDVTGEITRTGGGEVGASAVNKSLDRFRGTIRQRVPLTSAVKVDGEPLYRRAHRGEEAERPVRDVKVYDLAMTDFDPHRQVATIVVRTGKGAYIRTIVHDLGEALGVGAYAAELRRTRSGAFSVEDALSPAAAKETWESGSWGRGVLAPSEILSFLPALEVDGQEAVRVANGNELRCARKGHFRVFGPDGLLAVYAGQAVPDGESAHPVVVFPEPVG